MGLLIGANWGTSNLRAYLIDPRQATPQIVARVEGKGVAGLSADEFEPYFFEQIQPWLAEHDDPAIYVGGMATSNIGWREVPYAPCPLDPRALAGALVEVEARGHTIRFIPGVTCTNAFGEPDVMRGEETEILGVIHGPGEAGGGCRLICLPGTHCKWATVEDGALTGFFTSLAGELFDLLKTGSVLARGDDGQANAHAFDEGLALAARSEASLLHLLFASRARQVTGGLPAAHAGSFLSGLVIGSDVGAALAVVRRDGGEPATVEIVGTDMLGRLYSRAFGAAGVAARITPARVANAAGFALLDRARARNLSY